MRAEEFERLSQDELRQMANDCFAKADDEGVLAYLLKARFYLDEIEWRYNKWISRRDLWLDLIIIFLIVLEIIVGLGLGIHEGKEQAKAFDNQLNALTRMNGVLTDLEASSKATAATLVALQKTTEAMNAALHVQVATLYDISANVVYQAPAHHLGIFNNGKTNLILWAAKVGDEPLIAESEPYLITPVGGYEISIDGFYQDMVRQLPKGSTKSVPLTVYVKNENGKEFVVQSHLTAGWQNDALAINIRTTSIKQEEWSRKIKLPAH